MSLKTQATAEVMSEVVRLTTSQVVASGLTPGQWTALRYFAEASPSARRVPTFARYRGISASAARRTATSLIRKGFLNSAEGLLTPTDDGYAALGGDPLRELSDAIGELDFSRQCALAESLEAILRCLLRSRQPSAEAKRKPDVGVAAG